MVENASGQEFCATPDLKDAYCQVVSQESSTNITTFTDGVTLYRFKHLPFGLSSSPAIFSRIMNNLLVYLSKQVWVKNYLHDGIVWVPSFEELVQYIDEPLHHFYIYGVKLNVTKCNQVRSK